MAVERITAEQFRRQIRNGITSRTATHDTALGPIRDIVIDPVATVLERQNDRVRRVSLLVSLINSDAFTDAELEDFVFNEGLTRIRGARSVASLVFFTQTVTSDITVPRGFPVATSVDPSTGESVTFVTTEERTLPAVSATAFKNFESEPPRFELRVAAVATVEGDTGNVGATRINRTLRPLLGFEGVTNPEAAEGGRARETNAELIERYLLSVLGRDLVTPFGVERFARDTFPTVVDMLTVFGSDPLLTRAASDAGAVDAYIIGDQVLTRKDDLEFVGENILMPLTRPPVRTVTEVETTSVTYVEGTDYEVVFDTSGNANSTRAQDGIRFLSTAINSLPSPSDIVTVTYTSNELVRNMQTTFEQDDTLVFGRDLLIKEGTRVDITLEAQLRVAAGFSVTTTAAAVESTLSTFINGLGLDDNVEESDLQGEVRRISGVDNLIITRLVRDDTVTGAADIVIARNEYPRITASTDLQLTLI